jgi:hypothetical protein
MAPATTTDGPSRNLILTAMIFAVSMTFIDQTIILITAPHIQRDLGLSATGAPANTGAVNRASRLTYGEATGITQTVRNYPASLGIAVLGTILVMVLRSNAISSLIARGVPGQQAAAQATRIVQSQGGGSNVSALPHFVRFDFAHASQTVFLVMAGIMATAALTALTGVRQGRRQELGEARVVLESGAPQQEITSRP